MAIRKVQITTWQTSQCTKLPDGICFMNNKGKCLKAQVRNVYCKHVVTAKLSKP